MHATLRKFGSLYINQLQLINALARSGNLSDAAEQIGLSQSAASHALTRLRSELNDPLFIRTSGGMQPTPYGAQLAASLRNALEALSQGLGQPSTFVPASSERKFKILMNDIAQMLYLPGFRGKLCTEAPGVTLQVEPAPLKAPHSLLESGEIDLAVGTYTRVVSGCKQRLLYREHYSCVVRQDHPLFRNGMTVEAFQNVGHIVVDPRGYVHEKLDRLLAERNIVRKVELTVPYLVSLPLVIATSDLLATMSSEVADAFCSYMPLKTMPPPVDLPAYSIRVFWHERFHNDPANVWLRNLFLDLFKH